MDIVKLLETAYFNMDVGYVMVVVGVMGLSVMLERSKRAR